MKTTTAILSATLLGLGLCNAVQATPSKPATKPATKPAAKTAAATTPAQAAPTPVDPNFDPIQAEVERMGELYRAVTTYHLLMQGEGVTSDMVRSALYDVERYLDDIDTKLATDMLFIKDQKALDDLNKIAAKAHFQAAILHARGVDLEASITQYERTLDLLGIDPAEWDEEMPRTATPGLLPGAQEVAFQMTTPRAAVEDLKEFWASGVVTRFKARDLTPTQRSSVSIERIGGKNDAFSDAAYTVAAKRFGARVAEGQDEFRVVLPAGRYRVSSADQGFGSFEFQLVEGGVPDPIHLNPNHFTFAFSNPDDKCRPTLVLNGIAVKTFTTAQYGAYYVQRVPGCTQRLPDKITVDQNNEVTLRTEPEKLDYVREGQPIFLFITTPPGSTYTLRF